MKKKLLAILVSFFMVFSNAVSIFAIEGNKTATDLDEKDTTTVTLSIPSEEELKSSHIVFVLDKSTSTDVSQKAIDMLDEVKKNVSQEGSVLVDVVIFNRQANHIGERTFDLVKDYNEIVAAMQTNLSSGTNIHAGLIMAEQLLDADTVTDASRKYMVLVSDGISYMYDADSKVMSWGFYADSLKNWAGPDNYSTKYESYNPPTDWASFLEGIRQQYANQSAYEYYYGETPTATTPIFSYVGKDELGNKIDLEIPYGQEKENGVEYTNISTKYVNSTDIALLKSYDQFMSMTSKYNTYAINTYNRKDHVWGSYFMQYLGTLSKGTSWKEIQDDIIYYVGPGTTLNDVIGKAFDLTDLDSFTLKVGDKELSKVVDKENNTVYFNDENGQMLYYVEYTSEDEEQFTLVVNTNVTIEHQVQLSYTLQLVEKSTEPGEYVVPTNESAILYPVSSDQIEQPEYVFPIPTVTYKVEKVEEPEPEEPKEPEKTEKPEKTKKPKKETNTSTVTNAKLYMSICATAASLMGILSIMKLKRRK